MDTIDSTTLTAQEKVDILEYHLKNHSLIEETDGTIIDVQSINAILTVVRALKEGTKANFLKLSFYRMASISWKMIS